MKNDATGKLGAEAGSEAAAHERDGRKRFAPRGAGGRGSPFIRRMYAKRRALLQTIKEPVVRVSFGSIVKWMLQGDLESVLIYLQAERWWADAQRMLAPIAAERSRSAMRE